MTSARDDIVFTTPDGNISMGWSAFGHGDSFPSLNVGWRQMANGVRQRVTYKNGCWLTDGQLGRWPNRIRTEREAALWAGLIGRGGFEALLGALEDGESVWVFETESEVDTDPDLMLPAKQEIKRILRSEPVSFIVWTRPE